MPLAPISDTIPSNEDALEVRVASISAEIAAAIAQAQSRSYDDEGEDSGSGQEIDSREPIGPNTSGIRGLDSSGSGGNEEDGGGPASAGDKRKR